MYFSDEDMKLGPQTHFSAKSQSEGTIQLVPNHEKWQQLLRGADEEHGKECLWQLGAVSESVEREEA